MWPHRARACVQAARLHRSWAEVQGEVSRVVYAYDAATSGPTKWPRLTAFLQQQYGHIVRDFVQRCEADAEKKVAAARGHRAHACLSHAVPSLLLTAAGAWCCVCVRVQIGEARAAAREAELMLKAAESKATKVRMAAHGSA